VGDRRSQGLLRQASADGDDEFDEAVADLQRHHAASPLPITECTTLEIAQGTAVSGSAGKCRRARTTPSPEFCIPTSIEIVRVIAGP
jgi:hypothetical protein